MDIHAQGQIGALQRVHHSAERHKHMANKCVYRCQTTSHGMLRGMVTEALGLQHDDYFHYTMGSVNTPA